jgi:ribulose 1,5-bisphosphate synthetase/thiazole synthase
MGDMLAGNSDGAFTIKDVPVENLRPLKVIVVGAGFSGILAAIRIPERLRNVELVVYEKNDAVGGVWYGLVELWTAEWR